MSKTPNVKLIGLFTLVGIIFLLGFLFVFLKDKLFIKESDLIVLYFDESVKGLNVGSPVVLQGVEIGKVSRIDMIANIEDLTFKIPVYVSINNTNIIVKHRKEKKYPHLINRMVEKGLRGRLATQNFLTGQLMIELIMQPETPVVMKDVYGYREIPTVLSPLGELSQNLQDIPIRSTFEKFNELLDHSNKLVGDMGKTITSTEGDRANTFSRINKTIEEIGLAAQSLRNFADYIERHPETLLRGKKGY